MTSRSFCFTINNPTLPLTIPQEKKDKHVRYVSWQLESGDQGTRHYQGFIQLKSPQRISLLKSFGPDWARGHYEITKGTPDQAREYSRKEESRLEGPYEIGTYTSQGKRTDLQSVVDQANEGKTLQEIAMDNPTTFVRFHRGIERFLQVTRTEKRTWKTQLYIFWGQAGTGKSRWAHSLDEEPYFLRRGNGNSVWFDGYTGQSVVVLDDFYGWIPYDLLLRLTDRYSLTVDVKGGSVPFLAKYVVLTSNKPWTEWYDFANKPMDPEALRRRIDAEVELRKGDDFSIGDDGRIRGVVATNYIGNLTLPSFFQTDQEIEEIEALIESDSD